MIFQEIKYKTNQEERIYKSISEMCGELEICRGTAYNYLNNNTPGLLKNLIYFEKCYILLKL